MKRAPRSISPLLITLWMLCVGCDDWFLVPDCPVSASETCPTSPPDLRAPASNDSPPMVTNFREFDTGHPIVISLTAQPHLLSFLGFVDNRPKFLLNGPAKCLGTCEPSFAMKRCIITNWCASSEITNQEINNFQFMNQKIRQSGTLMFIFSSSSFIQVFENSASSRYPNTGDYTVVPDESMRHYMHPGIPAFAINTNDDHIFLHFSIDSYLKIPGNGNPFQAFAMGNLRKSDGDPVKLTFMAHQNGRVSHVFHQVTGVLVNDIPLAEALSRSILALPSNAMDTSGTIQAAFIGDINNDSYADYLFVRDNTLHIISYKGKQWIEHPSAFELWKYRFTFKPGKSNMVTEQIKSIFLVRFGVHQYPDLVIETDNNIYIYENLPPSG